MPRRSRLHSWIGLAVFLVSASTLAGEPQAKIGAKLTDCERVDAGGKAFKLTQVLQGSKAVVVDFWSSRCPVSQKYEPVLKKLAADYTGKGVAFLAVDSNYNEPAEEIQKVRSERGAPYPVLLDGKDATLAAYFRASHTPEAYLVTPDGVLAYHGNLDEIGGGRPRAGDGRQVPQCGRRPVV